MHQDFLQQFFKVALAVEFSRIAQLSKTNSAKAEMRIWVGSIFRIHPVLLL
jgi:hypothetical protein